MRLHTKNGRELSLEKTQRLVVLCGNSLSAQFSLGETANTQAGWRDQVSLILWDLFLLENRMRKSHLVYFILNKVRVQRYTNGYFHSVQSVSQPDKKAELMKHKMVMKMLSLHTHSKCYWQPLFILRTMGFLRTTNVSSLDTKKGSVPLIPLSYSPTFSLISPGNTKTDVWTLSKNQLRRTGGRRVSAGKSLSVSEAVWESEGASQTGEKREGGRTEKGDQVWTRWSTNLQGAAGLSPCTRDQWSNHDASALPGTPCHPGTSRPPGMRRGSVPRSERHGAHRAGREVSRGVRLEPFLGWSGDLFAWHIGAFRRGKGGFFRCARDQSWAVGDEQHVHDHLFWPGKISTQHKLSPLTGSGSVLARFCTLYWYTLCGYITCLAGFSYTSLFWAPSIPKLQNTGAGFCFPPLTLFWKWIS